MFVLTTGFNSGIQGCCCVDNLRGFSLFEKYTGQVQLQRGFHYFGREWFEPQCDIILSRRGTGKLLHIDIS